MSRITSVDDDHGTSTGRLSSTRTAASDASAVPDGRSTRWDEHRAARRAELVRAARKAVHRLGPDISMDEIATQLGTSKSIVYRYFTDKVGLQNAVGEAVVNAIHDTLDAAYHQASTPRAALQEMVSAYLAMIAHSPSVYYFVTRNVPVATSVAPPPSGGETAQSAPLSSFLHSVVALLARPFAQEVGGDNYDDAQINAWASGAVGFVTATGEWWLSNRDAPGTPDREAFATQITAWLWAGPIGLLARDAAGRRHT